MYVEKHKQQIIFSQRKKFNAKWFSILYLQENMMMIGSSSGRGVTWFFKEQIECFVLRHYFRGGLVGKINSDLFLYSGLENTRVYREFMLLELMQNLGLPCPKPIAGRVTRGILFYQADLIIELIEGAVDLVHLLIENPISKEKWKNIGGVIRDFHEHNIYHSDMNCHNIMIDSQDKIWVIDFDKCEQRKEGSWKEETLVRLHRSLHKEKLKNSLFYWQEDDWDLFLTGYYS